MKKLTSTTILLLALFCAIAQGQVTPSGIYDFLRNDQQDVFFKDFENAVEVDRYKSQNSEIEYSYFKQSFQGIPIFNSQISVAAKNGKIRSVKGEFIENIDLLPYSNTIGIAQTEIQKIVADQFGTSEMEQKTNPNENHMHLNQELQPIDLPSPKLVYYKTNENQLKLSYELVLHIKDSEELKVFHILADAGNGQILHQHDLVMKCNVHSQHYDNHDREFRKTFQEVHSETKTQSTEVLNENSSYRVFALPMESPMDGDRIMLNSPYNADYSPYGWHSDNTNSAYFNYTIGNNVIAMYDHDSEKYSTYLEGYYPSFSNYIEGNPGFNFDFPMDLTLHPNENKEASITNLFYMNNILHDIFYKYGFDEAAGNFQAYNFSDQGLGEDIVIALGQTGEILGALDNAYFISMAEGYSPLMLMLIFTPAAGNAPIHELLEITTPGEHQGKIKAGFAEFGPILPDSPVLADLVIMEDTNSVGEDSYDGCDPATNPNEINNKIAIVRRGSCEFQQKVVHAQNAGALGVVVVNNVSGEIGEDTWGMGGANPNVTISSIIISKEDGDPLIQTLESATLQASFPPQDFEYPDLNRRDSSFDNAIITHEFGHGISTRLTGGPSNHCLQNLEQMGEGWSDFFGLMMTTQVGDLGTDAKGMSNYVVYHEENDAGIRPTPYSTDMNINPATYESLLNYTNEETPHRLGYVWASMLWEMNWMLINKYGFNPDWYAENGGNNIAMQIVMEGLKLQECDPGFVDGRNAILEADQLLYDGENQCEIWHAFAKRGLGYYADQGDSNNRLDGVANFDMPPTQVLDCTQMEVDDFKINLAEIFPNPTSGILHIQTKELQNQIGISLFDLSGRMLRSENLKMNGNTSVLNISEQPNGVYILKVSTSQGSQTFKVIKN